MQISQIQRNLIILKATLLLREILGVRSSSKEEMIRMGRKYTDSELSLWLTSLQKEISKSDDERKREAEERIQLEMEHDFPQNCGFSKPITICCSNRDYGPSNPWDAPGMSVKDFI